MCLLMLNTNVNIERAQELRSKGKVSSDKCVQASNTARRFFVERKK